MGKAVLDVVGVVLELLVLLEVGFRHFEIEYNLKIKSPALLCSEGERQGGQDDAGRQIRERGYIFKG